LHPAWLVQSIPRSRLAASDQARGGPRSEPCSLPRQDDVLWRNLLGRCVRRRRRAYREDRRAKAASSSYSLIPSLWTAPARRPLRSWSTISLTSASKLTRCFQPSLARAFEGSPSRTSTSVGRK